METRRPDGLVEDPHAAAFVDAVRDEIDLPTEVDPDADAGDPASGAMSTYVGVRSRWFDEHLLDAARGRHRPGRHPRLRPRHPPPAPRVAVRDDRLRDRPARRRRLQGPGAHRDRGLAGAGGRGAARRAARGSARRLARRPARGGPRPGPPDRVVGRGTAALPAGAGRGGPVRPRRRALRAREPDRRGALRRRREGPRRRRAHGHLVAELRRGRPRALLLRRAPGPARAAARAGMDRRGAVLRRRGPGLRAPPRGPRRGRLRRVGVLRGPAEPDARGLSPGTGCRRA